MTDHDHTRSLEISDTVIHALIEKVAKECMVVRLSKKRKPIRMVSHENEKKLDVFVEVDYGNDIPDTIRTFQKRLKYALEKVTGLHIKEINITVDGLNLDGVIEK